MIEQAKRFLDAEGYLVLYKPEFKEMVTPKELASRIGLSSAGIHERLSHRNCPGFDAETGESGRIIRVRLTPVLMAFLTQKRSQGAALKKGEDILNGQSI